MMDYGKKILGKFGWKEGDGLGKKNDGLRKPIKANLKFDNLGFGADVAATEFNNHWWERVYSEASGNLEIKRDSKDGTTRLNLKNENNDVEIVTNSYSLKKWKKNCDYNNFSKSAILTNKYEEVENKNKIDISDISFAKHKQLSDEELFQACGGRTAHKGARHGLKLSGKLSRLEKQDQELLNKMKHKGCIIKTNELVVSPDSQCELRTDTTTTLKRKKSKKHAKNDEKLEIDALSKKKKLICL